MNAGAILNRINFGLALAASAVGPAALDGLAQVVGLALGSPEFQRR